jgi:putative Mg2+ transporter-C (MgtC) family protein
MWLDRFFQDGAFFWESSSPLDDLGKMALAMMLGGMIGLERKRQAHAAGMRTQMLVASASCLLMLVSIYITHVQKGDPGRIAAQVVAGIGFLGAGAIIRFGLTVRGLTTAASIWASAAIGLAVGLGYVVGAVGLTILVVVALMLFDPLESWLVGEREIKRIRVLSRDVPDLMHRVERILGQFAMRSKELGLTRDLTNGTVELDITAVCSGEIDFVKFSKEVGLIEGVTKVQIE